jgi:hypothetical protein
MQTMNHRVLVNFSFLVCWDLNSGPHTCATFPALLITIFDAIELQISGLIISGHYQYSFKEEEM